MTAAENVEEFLRQWDMMRDKGDVIYGVLADPAKDETSDLTVNDLTSLLDELSELREQLADRIVPVEETDTVVHLQNPPLDYGLPVNAVVRFATGPDSDDYIQVRCDHDGYVRIMGEPSLEIRTHHGENCVRVCPVRP